MLHKTFFTILAVSCYVKPIISVNQIAFGLLSYLYRRSIFSENRNLVHSLSIIQFTLSFILFACCGRQETTYTYEGKCQRLKWMASAGVKRETIINIWYLDDNFRILYKCRSAFQLKVMESICIKRNDPGLCRQK